MKTKHDGFRALMLVTLVAVAVACEDTDPTAPTNSTITVTASPAAVNIDQLTGQTQGQTTIVAQVIDPNGLPLNDIPLLFTSTGGLLSSVNNFCGPLNLCTRTPVNLCAVDSDCPPPPPPSAVVTNENGVATDVLTLRLFGDPNQVTVTVKGTNLEGSAVVDKVVNNGPADPIPVIVAQPGQGQRTGLPFKFNGSSSIFDPNVEPTCYDWKITSSMKVFDPLFSGCKACSMPGPLSGCLTQCVDRGPNSSDALVELTIGSEGAQLDQTLSVTLRVSDDPTIACNLDDFDEVVDDPKFGPNIVSINYDIDCDTTDPIVSAGNDVTVSLQIQGQPECDTDNQCVGSDGACLNDGDCPEAVKVSVNATATDPEFPQNLSYSWNCGDDSDCIPELCNTDSVICAYTTPGPRTAKVTVINQCGRAEDDTLVIDVDP